MTEASTERQGQWFAIQTLSNKEQSVMRHLNRYVAAEEMEDFIYESLMPTETVTEVKSGKKKQTTRKLYPGYLFLHMRLYDDDGGLLEKPWRFVNGVEGVIRFIGDTRPTPLKQEEIDRILAQVRDSDKEVPKVQYSVGEEIKITDGPFLNLTGRIDEIDPEAGKLKVSVSIFGRFTPVTLEYWQVERADEQ